MHKHHSALGLAKAPVVGSAGEIARGRPVQPVTLLRPHAAARAARFFVEKFPGRSLYAVKANPSPDLLHILWDAGVTHYDVASIGEVRLVRETLPEAVICFMHPVKAQEVIAEAYFEHNVRTFSLDTMDELEKRYIKRVLALVGGNKSRAAQMLGFDRRTLYRKLERYGERDGSGGDEGPDKDKAASSPGSASSSLS